MHSLLRGGRRVWFCWEGVKAREKSSPTSAVGHRENLTLMTLEIEDEKRKKKSRF